MRLLQCSCLLLALHLTQGQRGGFRVRPLITLDERPRNVAAASENRPQFAQQLAADGGVVTLSTTTSPPTTSRGGLFRPGDECRQDFHCKGNENCVRRNGKRICSRTLCNSDRDCNDFEVCRDQKCRFQSSRREPNDNPA